MSPNHKPMKTDFTVGKVLPAAIRFLLSLSPLLHAGQAFSQVSSLVDLYESSVFSLEAYDEFAVQRATGTGFFTSENGDAITSYSFLRRGRFALARLRNGEAHPITEKVMATKDGDLVAFYVLSGGRTFHPIPMAKQLADKGSEVFVIGTHDGYPNTVTTGTLSGYRSHKGVTVLQTTAYVSDESSGSPVIGMEGEALGFVTRRYPGDGGLHFAFTFDGMGLAQPDSLSNLYGRTSGDVRFVNRRFPGEKDIVLRSVELSDSVTVLNCSFTNTSIFHNDDAFIFASVDSAKPLMYLQGAKTGRRYRLLRSTLGTSADEPTYLKFGETSYFKLFFEPVGDEPVLDLKEDMKGGDWSFPGIVIPSIEKLTVARIEGMNRENLQEVLGHLSDKAFGSAAMTLDSLGNDSRGETFHRLSAAAAFGMGELQEAERHLREASKLAPSDAEYHAGLSEIHRGLEKTVDALKEIGEAIRLNDDFIEYRLQRAEILFQAKRWREAVGDYDRFEASGRRLNAYFHHRRGIARANLGMRSACSDLQKAKDLAESDREWELMQKDYKHHCGSAR
jgi:hypothetical protein